MAEITSRRHALVKSFKAAARAHGPLALLDGWHLLHDAVAAGVAIETVAIAGDPRTQADARLVAHLAASSVVKVISVSSAVMDALSPARTPAGVAALVRRPNDNPARMLSPSPALVVVAVDIQDPGNVGAVIRAAEAGGATGVVLAGTSADAWSWKALRAAMGSTFRLPVVRQPHAAAACDELRVQGMKLFAAVPRGGILMEDADFRVAAALLVGGEGSGLDAALTATTDARISIPMQNPVESLNVAVATGVLVYEARRQRGTQR